MGRKVYQTANKENKLTSISKKPSKHYIRLMRALKEIENNLSNKTDKQKQKYLTDYKPTDRYFQQAKIMISNRLNTKK